MATEKATGSHLEPRIEQQLSSSATELPQQQPLPGSPPFAQHATNVHLPPPSSTSPRNQVPLLSAASSDIAYAPTASSFTPVSISRPLEASPPLDSNSSPASTANSNGNPRQRSSIACLHCRRSKIRCVNEGIDTQCNACRNSGRECKYSVEMSKRGRLGEDEVERTPKRNKARKSETATLDNTTKGTKGENSFNGEAADLRTSRDGVPSLIGDGVIDPNILTPRVWADLFELFEAHYGTDLPFLHSPTFSKRLRESPDLHLSTDTADRDKTKKNFDPSKLPGWEMLTLGILALTARFHPALVKHLCTGSSNEKSKDPIHASEHYAVVLREMLVGSRGNYIGTPNLAKIQALLMLGLYEWGICNGVKAWIHVGLAIRMAQAMGLQFEDDQDFEPLALSSATRIEALHLDIGGANTSSEPLDPLGNDAFIEEEMRRRTFWSCFVMDRYLSSGKFRPSMLMLDEIKLQLPCSQNAFLFGGRVCTALLDGHCSGTGRQTERKATEFRFWQQQQYQQPSFEKYDKERAKDESSDIQVPCEYGNSEGILSIHVRMVEIWGRIAKWTCAGGIRNDRYPPWHELSTFHRLNESLRTFQSTLPRLYKLSKMNIEAHIAQHTSSPYILLQILFSSCTIILHRELIPFIPVRCNSPQGPLDNRHLQADNTMPLDFYVDSARQLFKAACDVMDLVQTCQSRCHLPETPVMGFGLYAVAFTEIYALNFPHMDPDGFVSGKSNGARQTSTGVKAASQMLEIIGNMRPRLPMANNWFRTIHRVHRYYKTINANYDKDQRGFTGGNMLPTNSTSIRSAGVDSAESQLALLEHTLKEFGSIEDEDINSWTTINSIKTSTSRMLNGIQGRDDQQLTEPVRAARDSSTSDSLIEGQRTISTSIRLADPVLRTDFTQHASTPSQTSEHSISLQLPSLSRGTTPTTSAASVSPYQGPTLASIHDGELRGASTQSTSILPQPHQHGGQFSNTIRAPHTPSSSMTSIHHNTLPPPYSHTYRQSMNDRSGVKPEDTQESARSPLWAQDLTKSMGGDDVAAFMDGLSCQEWAEAVALRAGVGFWGGNSSMAVGMGSSGSRDGWLTSVWRGSVGSVTS